MKKYSIFVFNFQTFKFLNFFEKNLKIFSEINKFFLNSNFISLYLNQSILGRRYIRLKFGLIQPIDFQTDGFKKIIKITWKSNLLFTLRCLRWLHMNRNITSMLFNWQKSIQSNYYINNNYDCNHLFLFPFLPFLCVRFAWIFMQFFSFESHSKSFHNHFIIMI